MRNISAQAITDTVARLCIEANTRLPQDVQAALDKARQEEPGGPHRDILSAQPGCRDSADIQLPRSRTAESDQEAIRDTATERSTRD